MNIWLLALTSATMPQAISAVKRPGKEQELISWEEVKDQKDVYQAIRTADGRQALVRAGGEQPQHGCQICRASVRMHAYATCLAVCSVACTPGLWLDTMSRSNMAQHDVGGCDADGTGQEELLYLEDPPRAAQDASAAQGPQAPAVFYVPMAAGQGPLYAYPVQYPDGRIMYHILPPQVAHLCMPSWPGVVNFTSNLSCAGNPDNTPFCAMPVRLAEA